MIIARLPSSLQFSSIHRLWAQLYQQCFRERLLWWFLCLVICLESMSVLILPWSTIYCTSYGYISPNLNVWLYPCTWDTWDRSYSPFHAHFARSTRKPQLSLWSARTCKSLASGQAVAICSFILESGNSPAMGGRATDLAEQRNTLRGLVILSEGELVIAWTPAWLWSFRAVIQQ